MSQLATLILILYDPHQMDNLRSDSLIAIYNEISTNLKDFRSNYETLTSKNQSELRYIDQQAYTEIIKTLQMELTNSNSLV